MTITGLSQGLSVTLRFADSDEVLSQDSVPTWPSNQQDAALIWPRGLYEQLTASSSTSLPRLNGRPYIAVDLPLQFSPYSSSSPRQNIRLPSLILPIANDEREQTPITPGSENGRVFETINQDHQQASVILPAPYRRFFPTELSLFESSIEVVVRPHIPLTLSHVILSAQSKKSFEYAQSSQEIIEGQIDGRLIRQDDLLSFGDSTFQVVMCEPVLQGIASQEDTEVFVTYDGQSGDINGQSGFSNAYGSSAINGIHDTSNIIVDEHFFTKGVLDSLESNVDGTAGESLFTDTSGTNFQPFPVQDIGVIKDALRSWSSRAWRDMSGFDVDNCILLDEATFPQLGSFEGDWALVEIENEGKARAVKMLCAPRGFQAQLQQQAQQGKLIGMNPSSPFAFLSPLLLQNLYHIGQFDPSRDTAKSITLRSLGSWQMTNTTQNRSDALPDCPLPLPFADSLTISRIAGPLSINRKYQNLFLGALRTYFEGGRRIVQQGDIFAVTFDKSKIRWAVDEGNEDETAGDKNKNNSNNEEEAYDITLPAPGHQNSSQSTGVVYFCVSDVTPEVSEPLSNNDGQPMQTDLWIHEMARTGQFGCAVDTMLTKMVQSGVTHSRVIDSQQWLSTASDTPPLPFSPSPLTTTESVFGRLLLLVKATLLPDAADYGLHLSVLLKGARGCGKRTIVRWVAQKTGVHIIELNCYDLIADTDARTEGILRARFEQAAGCAPAILLLRHVEALARKSQALETGQEPTMATVLQDCMASLKQSSSRKQSDGEEDASINTQVSLPIAVIGTTGDADRCPTGVLACFRHELNFEAPNEAERRAILDTCLRDSTLSVDVSLKSMATQTAALVASDLVDLVGRARMAAIERVTKQKESQVDESGNAASKNSLDPSIVEAGVALTGNDFDVALNKARLSYSENIGAPKIPNVTWDDVGGLISVKDDILDTIQLPLEHPELFSDGLKKRSGILLYGPPGTGKTLLAKAVATSCSLNFFSVKGPELLNMYIGESEANVRRVFQRARDAKPCVIFFDELDSIAPKRGNQGDSGGVMDRIVSQLLAELDGMSSGSAAADVFVIGATNRPDLLDPALLRPGRFDRMLYLAVSQTHSEQLNILQALTRKFKLDEDVGDLSVIAEQCPMNLTGADFYALCSDAMLKSMTRKAEWIDGQVALLNEAIKEKAEQAAKNGVAFDSDHPIPLTPQYYLDEIALPTDLDVKVSRIDFEAALAELVPSVSSQEMEHYRSVQQKFSNTDSKSEAESKSETQNNKQNGTLHEPIEFDNRTMESILAAMKNSSLNGNGSGTVEGYTVGNGNGYADAPPANGHVSASAPTVNSEQDADQQTRKSKGKGKARALD
ncbi:hypothetical protein L7F22_052777 [Adiantum nelumboides]|nr:hypothetical protein [Adiantum nelumboides]